MSDTSPKNERITARVTNQVKHTIEQAATLSGATVNQFVIQAALKEAQQILEQERSILLSYQDADQIFSLLENPPSPNEKLKAAAAKYQAFFRETH